MGPTVSKKELSPETLDISARLEKLDLFKGEKPAALTKIAECLSMKTFHKGDVLLKQGEPADSLFIIVSGEVSFSSVDIDTSSVRNLGKLLTGATFGEFGLVYNVNRTATATANTDVVCLILYRDIYDKIKGSKYMKAINERVTSVCSMLMRDGLKQLSFLQELDKETLSSIGHLFKFEVVPENTIICKQGEFGDRFYIVFHGELVVTMKDELGFDVEITRLHDGAKFGDTSLLSNTSRTATITTLTSCELFSLQSNDLKTFMNAAPNLGDNMFEKMFAFSNAALIEKSAPVFSSLTIESQQLLGVVSSFQTFPPKTVIIKEHSKEPNDIYVIVSGSVSIYSANKKVRRLDKGYFGEVSLFSDQPNTATVVVDNIELTCLVIPHDSFKSIMRRESAIYAEVAIKVSGKHTKLRYILRHPKARESFLKYCEKEFAQENVDFWLEVTNLEDLEHRKIMKQVLKALQVDINEVVKRKRNMLIERATYIFETFVKPRSPKEVNIASGVRESIIEKMKSGDYSYHMFRDAKNEVFKLLEADNFARYKESEQFKDFLKDFGAYGNLEAVLEE